MKKIYRKRKSAKIKEQALVQLRLTRRKIEDECPELLDSMKILFEKNHVSAINRPQKENIKHECDGNVRIDRQKNLETVLRFIELKPHSTSLKQELKKILS